LRIAPISWLVYYDVMRGRSELNLSTLASGQAGTPSGPRSQPQDLAYRLSEAIQLGHMPPAKYTLIHSGARLTSEQSQQLLKGLLATFRLSTQ
jgi:hypothetical protein